MTPRRPTVSKPQLLVDGNDSAFRSFIHDFLAFSAIVSDIRAGFGERLGMTGIGYTTLISIAYLQGRAGIGVNAVAEHLHLSGAFITTEVAKLVRAGLVHKGVNAKDKRRVQLTVTPAGRKLLNDLVVVQAPVNDTLFDCLSAAEFAQLRNMLARLVPCGVRALSLLSYLTETQEAEAGA
jgi:MarR family transcriptional regulator, organic hydroperoxide resistance regulator